MRHRCTPFFTLPSCILIAQLFLVLALPSCSSRKGEPKEEQISVSTADTLEENDSLNSIQGNVALSKLASVPNAVILTGLPDHRLVTVYKSREAGNTGGGSYTRYYKSSYDEDASEGMEHFMPGIDILYGYNLLNIAHYDLKTEKLTYLFNRPALIKTLYYPCFTPDSLNKQPIQRDYYLLSAYDEDTNKDTLINKKDLRRFYHFNADNSVKTQLVPADYSVIRSQYDSRNDVMYLFASHDANKNGTRDKAEPVHIFWFSLKAPAPAKRLY